MHGLDVVFNGKTKEFDMHILSVILRFRYVVWEWGIWWKSARGCNEKGRREEITEGVNKDIRIKFTGSSVLEGS